MVLLNIALGLLGLGIVIIVHEAGHFAAAKACGITVEAFSIGWGRRIASFTRNGTEYRISAFPVGGYCKMKGEELFKEAVQTDSEVPKDDPGSLFAVSPWARIVTYLSGPFANFLFAVLVLAVVWFFGFPVQTFDSKIVLLSEAPFGTEEEYPADRAGLETGDKIVSIQGHPVNTFLDVEKHITPNPGETLDITVERNGRRVAYRITPELNRQTGAGRIGVAAWVDPVIAAVEAGTSAERADLRPGDRITTANGHEIRNSVDLYEVLADNPPEMELTVRRNGDAVETTMVVHYDEQGNATLGFTFRALSYVERAANPFVALARGAEDSFETFVLSIKSIGLLFRGVDMQNAVSGPIRITYFVGEVATRSFEQGIGAGLSNVFRFLSLLSVALGFMNLLPIPALDGGMIVINVAEIVMGKPVRPKIFYRYQIVGFLIIVAILILTTFNDVLYFFTR